MLTYPLRGRQSAKGAVVQARFWVLSQSTRAISTHCSGTHVSQSGKGDGGDHVGGRGWGEGEVGVGYGRVEHLGGLEGGMGGGWRRLETWHLADVGVAYGSLMPGTLPATL